MTRDPYSSPFQRGSFVARFRKFPGVHMRQRNVYEAYFRSKDPRGFRHDLGAQDVFLDNMGIIFREQLTHALNAQGYLHELSRTLHGPWEATRRLVLPRQPWWGKYINDSGRRAATGEPRPRLRFMTDRIGSLEQGAATAEAPDLMPSTSSWPGNLDDFFEVVAPEDGELAVDAHEPRPYGLILPEHLRAPVPEVALLPVFHCTPDLPARVGVEREDRERYESVLDDRDQGVLPTCASVATVFALEVAAGRAQLPDLPKLSPAWLHLATGDVSRERRSLTATVNRLRDLGLPCSERALPYQRLLRGDVTRFEQLTGDVHEDQRNVARRFPRPEIVDVCPDDISGLKARLAAGWVLLLATRVTDAFQANPVAMTYGAPLLPLPGSTPTDAHAWCVVGYDHVDGALNWKYQGRFVALNSWGRQAHRLSPHGAGTLSLPFAFVFQEGFAAFAVRFEGQGHGRWEN